MSQEVLYLLVVVGLFIVPRVLQRFHIPSAITSVGLGAILGMGFGLFQGDTTVPILAKFGIVALFLFAGMDVDFSELRRGAGVTAGHIALQVGLVVGAVLLGRELFGLALAPAILLALALLTPSTGFILDSLPGFGLAREQQYWVKTKAIATELVALVALFLTIQSRDAKGLALSTTALVVMIAVLPIIFKVFVSWILPHAPKSEFGFLLILALVCAYVTQKLDVHYLVGAFVVGLTTVRMRKKLPQLATERLVTGIELFASFFIPFYFFKAGLHLETRFFTLEAILLGLAFVAFVGPIRIAVTALYRRLILREPFRDARRVGLSLTPTLVFTIVLADILREHYALEPKLYGALLVFALVDTLLPGLILKAAPSYDLPEAAVPEIAPDHAEADAEADANLEAPAPSLANPQAM